MTPQQSLLTPAHNVSSRQAEVLATCESLTGTQIPNLLRLYLNPWVAQTCLCLDTIARQFVKPASGGQEHYPSFLANSRDEALSGAIKLARFTLNTQRITPRSQRVLVVDPGGLFRCLGGSVPGQNQLAQTLPDVVCCSDSESVARLCEDGPLPSIVVLATTSLDIDSIFGLRDLLSTPGTLCIQCVTLEDFAPQQLADIVVFDESFVDHAVPFSAFTAPRTMFEPWMTGGLSMFHSTTFQPNTLTTMHFMRCVRSRGIVPDDLHAALDELPKDVAARHAVYQRLFSPSLSKLISTTGFDLAEPAAHGHFIELGDRQIIDCVAGVACSLRGHNPRDFVDEIRGVLTDNRDLVSLVAAQLESLTRLPQHLPSVGGGSANELALKVALAVRPDRPHVLALKGGFGGKTLTALTGTSHERYKQHLGPLYPRVTYIDPYAEDAAERLTTALAEYPVGVVQLELIQGVGGVREVPKPVLDVIAAEHSTRDFVLLVDEVQTGMFRTGPFLRSSTSSIQPDIVTLAKGTSDMMIPFAAVLLSESVYQSLMTVAPELAEDARRRFAYPVAYAALYNSLTRAVSEDWARRVRHQAAVFRKALSPLSNCRNVADVRVFGMLIGIEINIRRGPMRLLGRHAARLYALAMLEDQTAPVLVGFCQYEPHVLKLTPGLLMNRDEITQAAGTICRVLPKHPLSVLLQAVKLLLQRRFSSRSVRP
jgi:acetylornithine/succinyldiaminopimelate/putrescine aminotransferase